MSNGGTHRLKFLVEEALQGGVYANMLAVWHTGHEFTLDFAATLPAQPAAGPDGAQIIETPCRVTARIKVPPTMVFQIIKALNDNMTNFEAKFGPIQQPGQDGPLMIPDDLIGGPPAQPPDLGDDGPGGTSDNPEADT